MTEHTFGFFHDEPPTDEQATELAADLAELLIEEVARAQHRWRLISVLAAALFEVAACMARPPPPRVRSRSQ